MSQPFKPEDLISGVTEWVEADKKQHHCAHQADCMKMIQLVLDGEASAEQFEHIRQNIGKCLPCEKGYNLETRIKEALQLRLEKKTVPDTLLESIRTRVTSI